MALDYDAELVEALRRVYGDDVGAFLESLRRPGRRLYARVNTLRIDPESLVESLRRRGIEVFIDEDLREAVYFLVEGPASVEPREPYVVADKYAAESVYVGSDLYAPGVLACDESIDRGTEVTVVAQNGLVVARGVAAMSCDEMLAAQRGLAVRVIEPVYRAPRLGDLPEVANGLLYPQSLPAMYVAHVLDPQPGETIVDMCAAPGGKASHVYELARGRVRIVAVDHSRARLEKMRRLLETLGHRGIELLHADSRYLHLDYPTLRADRVIVDPPCSSLGVRPKVFDSKTYREVEALSRYQIQFLRTAARIVKRGGVIVYSTCTVTVEENEAVIESVVEETRCLEVEDTGVVRGSRGVWGVHRDLYTRFHPHIHDVTGFFIAKLRKTCDETS